MRKLLLILMASVLPGCSPFRDGTDEHDMTELMIASRDGDVEQVSRKLEQGARVNQTVRGHNPVRAMLAFVAWMQDLPDRDPGYTALHYAASSRHLEVAKRLVDAGADPNAVTEGGATPLTIVIASRASDIEFVRFLLRLGATPDAEGTVPSVLLAAGVGNPEVVSELLAHGASPDPVGADGMTPLIVAARQGHLDIVRVLLDAGADRSKRDARAGWTAAQWAIDARHDAVAAALGAAGDTPATESDSAGETAGAASDVRTMKLVRAVKENDVAMVARLLEDRVSPNARLSSGQTLLWSSVISERVELAKVLLAAGADFREVPRGDISLLERAAQLGNLGLVDALIGAGARANEPGMASAAAGSGNIELLKKLESAGAGIHEYRDQPLRSAASVGAVDIVRYLLEKGARVDAADGERRTALVRAVAFGQPEVVRVLLDAGANAGQKDAESGWTPLMGAAMQGDSAIISMLVRSGADPAARDTEGKTAADHARGAGKAHVIPLLRRGE
jgi:ankyrin repeat protein